MTTPHPQTNQPFIRSLNLTNVLSFGPKTDELECRNLNVLVGANATGKSNLLEVIGLLGSLEDDLAGYIRRGGGVGEWLFKGGSGSPTAKIEAKLNYPDGIPFDDGRMPIRYRVEFAESGNRLELTDEAVENAFKKNENEDDVFFFYRYQQGHPVLSVADAQASDDSEETRGTRQLKRQDLDPEQSVLAQREDPDVYPELSWLSDQFSSIQLYRDWTFGRHSPPREAQKADLPADHVQENANNLGLVLNDLLNRPEVEERLLNYLTDLYPSIKKVHTQVHAGKVQIFVHERGLGDPIPATRLSDGTLRYIFLLTVLCHPDPPPVICLEEPELGLHPKTLPRVAGLLKKASQRTQLFVTTHSSYLLQQFDLDEMVVATKENDQTRFSRPENSRVLRENLEDFGRDRLDDMHRNEELKTFSTMSFSDSESKTGE